MANNNMKAHQQTYGSVMNFLKWLTIGACAVAALVIVLIS